MVCALVLDKATEALWVLKHTILKIPEISRSQHIGLHTQYKLRLAVRVFRISTQAQQFFFFFTYKIKNLQQRLHIMTLWTQPGQVYHIFITFTPTKKIRQVYKTMLSI